MYQHQSHRAVREPVRFLLQFRVDDHLKTERILEIVHGRGVLRVADTRNCFGTARPLGQQTGEKVDFVVGGDRNKQVSLADFKFGKRIRVCGISSQSHYIKRRSR